ncbi:MAG TPA: ribosome maturation factor RimP [Arenimonas sp.]|uniref:ribosome maturation factor RimP n=1 Tax=Arenimonas sp. TaxID=1872635 RepID=UPI002D1021E3|nr:ribosome maturation factor RimP [Arenimonas sp.]HMB56653.1 ribosome maturation factor RimP [Arenimonas sp.]
MSGKAEEIVEMLTPVVASLGIELLGVEFAPTGNSAMLRLYIDVEGRKVAIEDCEAVSREVSALLDVNDPISSEYTLEVSSPGIDRPIFTPAQFARLIGEQAKVTLRLPQEGRRRLQGKIVRVDGNTIVIEETGKGELSLAHDNIEKARLVPDLVALGLAIEPGPGGQRGSRRKTKESDKG